MMTTLDRMVLFAFFRSYRSSGRSLIGLFVVIDLFTHLDAFVNRPGGFLAIAATSSATTAFACRRCST